MGNDGTIEWNDDNFEKNDPIPMNRTMNGAYSKSKTNI